MIILLKNDIKFKIQKNGKFFSPSSCFCGHYFLGVIGGYFIWSIHSHLQTIPRVQISGEKMGICELLDCICPRDNRNMQFILRNVLYLVSKVLLIICLVTGMKLAKTHSTVRNVWEIPSQFITIFCCLHLDTWFTILYCTFL